MTGWQQAAGLLREWLQGNFVYGVTHISDVQYHVRIADTLHMFLVSKGTITGYCGAIEYSRAFEAKPCYTKLWRDKPVEPTVNPVQLRLL